MLKSLHEYVCVRAQVSSKNSLLLCWQIWSASITERQIYLHMTHITHHITHTHTHTGRETQTQGWKYISSSPSFTHKARLIFSLFHPSFHSSPQSHFCHAGIEIDDKFSLCQAADVHLRAFPPLSQYVFQSGTFSHKTSASLHLSLDALSLSLSLSLSRGLSQRSVHSAV